MDLTPTRYDVQMQRGQARGWRVGTGFIGPEPVFASVVNGSVWLGSRGHEDESRRLAAFDVATGTPGPQLELAAPLDPFDVIDGPVIAQQPSRGVVAAFDLAACRPAFSATFEAARLIGAHEGRLLLTRDQAAQPELLVIDARSGALLHTVALGEGLKLRSTLPFLQCAGGRALVIGMNGLVGVDLERGAIAMQLPLRSPYTTVVGPVEGRAIVNDGNDLICIDIKASRIAWQRPHLGFSHIGASADGHVFVADATRFLCCELSTGKTVWWVSVSARAAGKETSGVRIGHERAHLIAVREYGDEVRGPEYVVTPFDRRTGVMGPSGVFLDVEDVSRDELFRTPVLPRAVVGERQVELQLSEARVIRLPLPPGRRRPLLWAGDRLLVAGRELLGIDLGSLPATSAAGLTLTAVPSATAADAPAVVTFVATAAPVVMLKHPLYGTVRVSRGPTSPNVRIGGKVTLEGLTLLPGGVANVDSWKLADGANAPRELVLGVEGLPAREPLPAAEARWFA